MTAQSHAEVSEWKIQIKEAAQPIVLWEWHIERELHKGAGEGGLDFEYAQ